MKKASKLAHPSRSAHSSSRTSYTREYRPTTDAIERTVAFPNFHLYLAAEWESARVENDQIVNAWNAWDRLKLMTSIGLLAPVK